jgi:hypothetical protein
MKEMTISIILFVFIAIFGCQGQHPIDLCQYEQYFRSNDTTTLEYIRFSGNDTNIVSYATRVYNSCPTYDSMYCLSKIDTPLIFLSQMSYTYNRIHSNEYYCDNPRYNSGYSIKYKSDSIIFNSFQDGQVKSYSIPSKVKVGDFYLNGGIAILRNERLHLNNHDYDCLVIRWSTKDFKCNLWIDPAHFIIMGQMVGTDGNREVMIQDKGQLSASVNK